jgi:hypothetical protein
MLLAAAVGINPVRDRKRANGILKQVRALRKTAFRNYGWT